MKRKRRFEDLTGQKFGTLTVLRMFPREHSKYIMCECKCDCGSVIEVRVSHLKSGHTTSCGCKKKGRTPTLDLTGQRFGRWTVLEMGKVGPDGREWLCQCDCGTLRSVSGRSLRFGRSKSCGCLKAEHLLEAHVKHGKASMVDGRRSEKLYSVWDGMKQRCINPNHAAYKYYGAVGVSVCEEWANDFMTFYEWSMENGYQEGLSIDRINPYGNYEPNNCRWTTWNVQAHNKRKDWDEKSF